MRLKKGSTRYALIIGKTAFKMPRFFSNNSMNLKSFLFLMKADLKQKILQKNGSRPSKLYSQFLKSVLRNGIIANRNEYKHYQETKLPILAQTYFSLFGLLNIQTACEPITYIKPKEFCASLDNITNCERRYHGHDLSNIKNFGILNNEVKIVDYDKPEVLRILKKYGEKIISHFKEENKRLVE